MICYYKKQYELYKLTYYALGACSSIVVLAALLGIFGKDVVELPLVATNRENQGKVRPFRTYSLLENCESMDLFFIQDSPFVLHVPLILLTIHPQSCPTPGISVILVNEYIRFEWYSLWLYACSWMLGFCSSERPNFFLYFCWVGLLDFALPLGCDWWAWFMKESILLICRHAMEDSHYNKCCVSLTKNKIRIRFSTNFIVVTYYFNCYEFNFGFCFMYCFDSDLTITIEMPFRAIFKLCSHALRDSYHLWPWNIWCFLLPRKLNLCGRMS